MRSLDRQSPAWRALARLRQTTTIHARRTERACLTALAWSWRRLLWRTTFVAVTGSLGKTTTRELLHAVLSEVGSGVRTARNLNLGRHRGPQRTILAARPWHRHCVVELGIERPGDMAQSASLVRPDVALLLNLGRCHTRSFATLDALATEKARVFEHVRPGGTAVLNEGYPEIAALVLPAHLRRVGFIGWRGQDETRVAGAARSGDPPEPVGTGAGTGTAEAHRRAVSCRLRSASSVWPERLTVELEYRDPEGEGEGAGWRRACYRTALVGEHWANAVVATVATARASGLSEEAIMAGLGKVPNWSRRLEPVRLAERGATYVRDEYNGSIETLRSSLAWLARARAARRIVVHGDASDMLASGRDRTRAGRLAALAAAACDQLVPITPYADVVRRAAHEAGLAPERVTPVVDVHGAIAWCRAELGEGDVLLCKGRDEQKLGRVYLGLFDEVTCRRESCALKRDCAECPELGFTVTRAMLDGTAPTRRAPGDTASGAAAASPGACGTREVVA